MWDLAVVYGGLEGVSEGVEWAVCETPGEERVSSSVGAARERGSLASMEMAAERGVGYGYTRGWYALEVGSEQFEMGCS